MKNRLCEADPLSAEVISIKDSANEIASMTNLLGDRSPELVQHDKSSNKLLNFCNFILRQTPK